MNEHIPFIAISIRFSREILRLGSYRWGHIRNAKPGLDCGQHMKNTIDKQQNTCFSVRFHLFLALLLVLFDKLLLMPPGLQRHHFRSPPSKTCSQRRYTLYTPVYTPSKVASCIACISPNAWTFCKQNNRKIKKIHGKCLDHRRGRGRGIRVAKHEIHAKISTTSPQRQC